MTEKAEESKTREALLKTLIEEEGEESLSEEDFNIKEDLIEQFKLYMEIREKKKETANCKFCVDTGWRPQVNHKGEYIFNNIGMLQEKPCDCEFMKGQDEELKKMGLYQRIKMNKFDNYKTDSDIQEKAKNKALKYVKNFKDSWIVFSGQTGAGKTHLALATWNKVRITNNKRKMIKGTKARIVLFNDLITELTTGLSFNTLETTEEVLEKYKTSTVLMIDDLFRSNVSEKAKEWIFQILDYRSNNNMPTIITTNHSLVDIMKIDEPIQGRMFENTGRWTYWVEFDKNNNLNYRMKN